MTRDQLVTRVQQELKGLATKLVVTDYTNAVTTALEDTGWTLPVTSAYRIKWLIQRTKRHLFEMLQFEAASKFKVDGINLQQRFDHYSKLVEKLDKEWDGEQGGSTEEDYLAVGGVKIDAGFVYERLTHRDLTYTENAKNCTKVSPSSNERATLTTTAPESAEVYSLTGNFAGNGGGVTINLPRDVSSVDEYGVASPVLTEDPKSGGFEQVGNVWVDKGLASITVYNDGEATAEFVISVWYV